MMVLGTTGNHLSEHPVHLMYSFLVLLIQLCKGSEEGSRVTMLTEGDVYVLNPGEKMDLGCEFNAKIFNLFDYPVLWRKYQMGEKTQVNIMGNINDPYDATNRFEAHFTDSSPRYRLVLRIHELVHSDSGNYTCEVRGPMSQILGTVTHYVYVRAPIISMTLSSDNGTTSSMSQRAVAVATLTLTEKQPTNVQCFVTGGYPPPRLEMFLGRTDVSSEFEFRHDSSLEGDKGLKSIIYKTQRLAETFKVTADDDGKRLKCIASVPGLQSNISLVKLNILYGPRIQCHRSGAYIGDKNVDLKCEIRSKPSIITLSWIIDSNGSRISNEGESVNGHWIKINKRDDGITETQLLLREAKVDSFHTYTLVAENKVGLTKEDIALFKKYKASSKQPLSTEKENRRTRIGRTDYISHMSNPSTKVSCVWTDSMFLMMVSWLFYF